MLNRQISGRIEGGLPTLSLALLGARGSRDREWLVHSNDIQFSCVSKSK
jgi:hypothetical protein